MFSIALPHVACDPDDSTQPAADSNRGPLGKSDGRGSCALSDCGGPSSSGSGWCDASCAGHGDCAQGVELCGFDACHEDDDCPAGSRCELTDPSECVGDDAHIDPDDCTVTVPQDYESVSAAIAGLAGAGGRICVGAGSFSAHADIDQSSAMGPLEIVGISAEQSTLFGDLRVRNYPAGVTIERIKFTGLVTISANTVIRDSRFVSAQRAWNLLISGDAGAKLTHARVERCEFTLPDPSSISAIRIVPGQRADQEIEVVNSYVHHSRSGIEVYVPTGEHRSRVSLVNNTIVDQIDYGIVMTRPTASVRYVNNLIGRARIGVTIAAGAATAGHNAYFDNGTNFAGGAVPGPGAVTHSPRLSDDHPPRPLAGSPLIDAGDAASAPAVDFHGVARTALADIGCVEH